MKASCRDWYAAMRARVPRRLEAAEEEEEEEDAARGAPEEEEDDDEEEEDVTVEEAKEEDEREEDDSPEDVEEVEVEEAEDEDDASEGTMSLISDRLAIRCSNRVHNPNTSVELNRDSSAMYLTTAGAGSRAHVRSASWMTWSGSGSVFTTETRASKMGKHEPVGAADSAAETEVEADVAAMPARAGD